MADILNLSSRQSKLQKEQQKRREAAKLRLQKEKRAKEAAARDQARIEEQIRQRKLEQWRKEEEERRQEQADQIRTGGIAYKESLRPVAAEGEGDKVLLPPSALDSLSRQDAVSMGPMFFELTCGADRNSKEQVQGGSPAPAATTHAGVLEFVADEGTIGLPRKVMLSLLGDRQGPSGTGGGSGGDAGEDAERTAMLKKLGSVTVRYVRLAKATFARVVPETVGLSQVSELRAMLEHNMQKHATLTVGDRMSVWRRGKEFGLKVVELKPEPQVTVIDTDMEIDLDLPDEAREQLEAKDARDRAQTLRAHMDTNTTPSTPLTSSGVGSATGGHSLSPTRPQPPVTAGGLSPMDDDSDSDSDSDDDASGAAKNVFDPEKHRLAKLDALPEEPAQDEEGVFTCQLRSSRGKFARRFRHEDDLGILLDFAEAHGGVPGHYRVVMPYPRKVFTRDGQAAGTTLKAAGLTSKQEAVILETY